MKEFLENMTRRDYAEFRKSVIKSCMICGSTFRLWEIGKTAVPRKYHATINAIAKGMGLGEIFTDAKD